MIHYRYDRARQKPAGTQHTQAPARVLSESDGTNPLLCNIERYLSATGMTPAGFGRLAVGDSRLVRDMRAGRSVGPDLAAKVNRFLTFATRDQAVAHA